MCEKLISLFTLLIIYYYYFFTVLNYDPKSDSVLQVNEEDYNNCNKAQPIKSYEDGVTKILLDRSGPFFFISGANGHCEKGQKLDVIVLSPKHSSSIRVKFLAPTLAPAPAPESESSGMKVEIIGGFIVMLASIIVLAYVN